ncbi:MAG: thioredoxin domain-containing protein [Nannocystaceae bacterium]
MSVQVSRILLVLFVVLPVFSLGCSQPTTTSVPERPAKSHPQACSRYAAAVCDEAGETSPACVATTRTATLLHPEACDLALRHFAYSKQRIALREGVCRTLATRLCADLGAETKACRLVRTDLVRLEPQQCEQMVGAYPEIRAELEELERSLAPLGEADRAALAGGEPPSFGPLNAAITLVEFSDFECPYCGGAASVVQEVKAKYGAEVRFIFRQFPLGFHENAHLAAEAALAAHAQGKFWAFHDLLFANRDALTRPDLDKYAERAGLDVAAFRRALDDGSFASAVDADVALGRRMGVDGTPTLFLNGGRVSDPTDFVVVSEAIESAR